MKLSQLVAVFAVLVSISLFVSRHDHAVAPLRRALDQRSIGRGEFRTDETDRLGSVAPSRGREGEFSQENEYGATPDASVMAGVDEPKVTSEVAAVAPVDGVEVFSPVAASSPGNAMHLNGWTVLVRGFHPVAGASGVALTVSVEKRVDPDVPDDAPSEQPVVSAIPRRGLSYQDELFRTKWGWSAFADVQRVALEAHSD
ncbi:MAG: hypothetical protein QM755_23630 [Luteolibacter sp.]